MSDSALARDPSVRKGRAAVEPPPLRVIRPLKSAIRYQPFTGEPVVVTQLEAICPRCDEAWEWPLGLDATLDRRASRGLVVDVCPPCLDDWADERAVEEGWT